MLRYLVPGCVLAAVLLMATLAPHHIRANAIGVPSAADLVAGLVVEGLPIGRSVSFTVGNADKVDFADTRLSPDGPSVAVADGGSVEVFHSADDAQYRASRVTTVTGAAEYDYLAVQPGVGGVLLRLSGQFTPSQAQQYANALGMMIWATPTLITGPGHTVDAPRIAAGTQHGASYGVPRFAVLGAQSCSTGSGRCASAVRIVRPVAGRLPEPGPLRMAQACVRFGRESVLSGLRHCQRHEAKSLRKCLAASRANAFAVATNPSHDSCPPSTVVVPIPVASLKASQSSLPLHGACPGGGRSRLGVRHRYLIAGQPQASACSRTSSRDCWGTSLLRTTQLPFTVLRPRVLAEPRPPAPPAYAAERQSGGPLAAEPQRCKYDGFTFCRTDAINVHTRSVHSAVGTLNLKAEHHNHGGRQWQRRTRQ